jgi:raffinose/stachyose/melibiose transport system permease protein
MSNTLVLKKKQFNWSDFTFRIILLIPTLLLLCVFMFYPIIETFRISLTKSTGFGPETFIGFQNYIKIFSDEDFIAGFIHVLQWAFWSILIQIPISFFIAFICSVYKTPVIKSLKSIYFLGNVIPLTIIATLGLFIFMPNSGAIVTLSKILKWGWLESIDFLGSSKMAFWTLFFMATWAYIGFQIVYFMANVDQIPSEIYEAAMIDGATKRQYAWYIAIPQVLPAIRIQILLSAIGSIKLFDLPWIMTVGGPGNATYTLGIVLYKMGFNNQQYGKGAAVGVVIFFLCLIFTVIQFSIQNKEE